MENLEYKNAKTKYAEQINGIFKAIVALAIFAGVSLVILEGVLHDQMGTNKGSDHSCFLSCTQPVTITVRKP